MGLKERVFGRQSARDEIDLREYIPADDDPVIEREHRDGYPDDCPRCGGSGYLDRMDMVSRRQWQHCRDCKMEWSVPID